MCIQPFDNVYLIETVQLPSNKEYFLVDIKEIRHYEPFCDGFGPMNLASIHQFCELLDTAIDQHTDKAIMVWNGHSKPELTNACFLLGAYMVVRLGLGAAAVAEKFASLLPDLMRYRDISPGPQNFELQTATGYEALLHLHKCAELVLVDIRALPHRDRRRFGPWHSGHGLRRGPAAAAVAAAAAQPGLCSRCHKLAMVPEQEAGVG